MHPHPGRAPQGWPSGVDNRHQELAPQAPSSRITDEIGRELEDVPEGTSVGDCGHRLHRGGHRVPEAPLRPLIYGVGHKAGDLVRGHRITGRPVGDSAARNLVWELSDLGIEAKFLIRDHDAKFGGVHDLVMQREGLTVIKTPIRAPLANSHIERQNGSLRRECLDWILITNRRHLERVLTEWFAHYNEERPHRALRLKTPIARSDPVEPARVVDCHARLGGLLRSYSAKPATVAA